MNIFSWPAAGNGCCIPEHQKAINSHKNNFFPSVLLLVKFEERKCQFLNMADGRLDTTTTFSELGEDQCRWSVCGTGNTGAHPPSAASVHEDVGLRYKSPASRDNRQSSVNPPTFFKRLHSHRRFASQELLL